MCFNIFTIHPGWMILAAEIEFDLVSVVGGILGPGRKGVVKLDISTSCHHYD